MPHNGGYLPGAFVFTPVTKADLSLLSYDWYGSIAASTKNNYNTTVERFWMPRFKADDAQVVADFPDGTLTSTASVLWSLENTDGANPHSGGYYFTYMAAS
jgi:hypothetical protein